MTLRIENTLTNKKEEFVPIEKGKVKMYVCGVTVYDDIHMGHARSIITFDVVRRYLQYSGYDVTFVTNFTDVDDKIINRANERGIDPLKLSADYIDKYFEDIAKLGVRKADIYPQASTSMPYIIDMVKTIIDKGYGYATPDGSVYFRVKKVPDYGELSNRSLEEMRSSGRVDLDPDKEDPMDFAIWKAAKPGECFWESPWGKGRLPFVHRIAHVPLSTKPIHDLHHLECLVKRHVMGFDEPFFQCQLACQELILVAGNLLRYTYFFDESTVGSIDAQRLGIIDVVNHQTSFCSGYDAFIVSNTAGRRLNISQHPIFEHK